MQIQLLDNNKSIVKFKSNNSVEKASAFVNMDDQQLRQLAYVMSYDKDNEKKKHKSALKMFYAIPIVDTIASGIIVGKSRFARNLINKLTAHAENTKKNLNTEAIYNGLSNPNLKNRLKAAGSTAGSWALWLSVIGIYTAVKDSIVSKSDSSKKFQRNNPISSFILDVGAIFAGYAVTSTGLNKLKGMFPTTEKELSAKTNALLGKANKSSVNREILPKLSEGVLKLEKTAPWLVKSSKFALVNSVWILFGLSLLKSSHHAQRDNERVDKNYRKLKKAQFETSKRLNKALQVEKEILTQNQQALTKELKKQMNSSVNVPEKQLSED